MKHANHAVNTVRRTELAPGLIRLEMPGEVFCYLLLGKDRALLIDTGLGTPGLKEYVESITIPAGLEYDVLLTHGHLDHAGGAGGFDRVYLNRKDWNLAQNENSPSERLEYLEQNNCHEYSLEDLEPVRDKDYLSLEDGQEFDLGGLHVKTAALAGHTLGFTALWIDEYKILLLGDGLCSLTLLQFDHCTDLETYHKSVCSVRDAYRNKAQTILYSHPHNFGGPEILDEMADITSGILDNTRPGIYLPDWGGNIFLAREIGPDNRRTDGKAANLVYKSSSGI